MRKLLAITLTILGCSAFCPRPALALVFSAPNPKFVYTDASGKKQSAQVVDKYYPKKIVQPFAKADSNIDPKLRRAAAGRLRKELVRIVYSTSGKSEDPISAGKSRSRARTFPDASANSHRDVVRAAEHLDRNDARVG